MHQLNASQDVFCGLKGLKAEHRSSDMLGRTMILFDDIIEILDLPNDGRNFLVFDDLINARFVGAELVHRDFFRGAVILRFRLSDLMRQNSIRRCPVLAM